MREREGRRFVLDFLGYRARCFPRDGDPQENHPSWIGYPSISAIPWTGLWGKCCCPVSLFLRVSTSLGKRGTPFSSVYILLSRRLFSRALSELSLSLSSAPSGVEVNLQPAFNLRPRNEQVSAHRHAMRPTSRSRDYPREFSPARRRKLKSRRERVARDSVFADFSRNVVFGKSSSSSSSFRVTHAPIER